MSHKLQPVDNPAQRIQLIRRKASSQLTMIATPAARSVSLPDWEYSSAEHCKGCQDTLSRSFRVDAFIECKHAASGLAIDVSHIVQAHDRDCTVLF